MDKAREIGRIGFEFDTNVVKKIAAEGRLEEFVDKAVAIFARDLKAELIDENVSSVSTALMFYDDEYGTGPRPPHWHNIGRIERLASRLSAIEKVIGLNEELFTEMAGRAK